MSACQQGLLENTPQATQNFCNGNSCETSPVTWTNSETYSQFFYSSSDERKLSGFFQADDKKLGDTGGYESICFDPTQTGTNSCQIVRDPAFQQSYGIENPVVIQNFRLSINVEGGIVFKGGWIRTALIDLDESTGLARFTDEDKLVYPRVEVTSDGDISVETTNSSSSDFAYCNLNQTHASIPGPNTSRGPNYQVGYNSLYTEERVLTGLYLVTQSSVIVTDPEKDERNYYDAYLTGGAVSVAGIDTYTHSFGRSFEFLFPFNSLNPQNGVGGVLSSSTFFFGLSPNSTDLLDRGTKNSTRYVYPSEDSVKSTYVDTNVSGEKLWYSYTFGKDYFNFDTQEMATLPDSYWKERVILGVCLNGYKTYNWSNISGNEIHPLFQRSQFKAHQIFTNN